MNKRVTMQARPNRSPKADQWIESRPEPQTPLPPKPKRLTIDIDPTLHLRLKIHSAAQQIQMADLVRDLIQNALPND